MNDDETVGELVDEAQAAHPGSIYRNGMRITYRGSMHLQEPPGDEYRRDLLDADGLPLPPMLRTRPT